MFDDWELEVRAYENGTRQILIMLPHYNPEPLVIDVEPNRVAELANILDAGLNALSTDGKAIDGSNPAGST